VSGIEIAAPERRIELLREKLAATDWPAQPDGMGWELGTDLGVARNVCDHWAGTYDWRAVEARLNSHENLRHEGVHALRVSSSGDGVPVVLLHGWPSSPLEYLPAAELLAAAGHTAIVPSLPGFAWSDDPGRPLNVAAVSERLRGLLGAGLGVERYAVAGGDWGAIIGGRMAYDSPETVSGLYLSTPGTLAVPGELGDPPLSDAEQAYVETGTRWRRRHGHHLMIQGSAPDAISTALTDSPAGLAAYLLDKYARWADGDGDPQRAFTDDQLCDFLSAFWMNDAIASSMRIYWGEGRDRWRPAPGETIDVPAAASVWQGGVLPDPPREWTQRLVPDLRSWTEMERGGHFAALEEPEAYTQDLGAFLSSLR
jgi:pimeloyl-ACP methyl ester carboxylesterase